MNYVLMETPEHYKHYTSMQHGLSWTPINDTVININTNAVCDYGCSWQ